METVQIRTIEAAADKVEKIQQQFKEKRLNQPKV